MSVPRIEREYRTTINLKVIQYQLDIVERALLQANTSITYRAMLGPAQTQQLVDALDYLLAVKKSFGLTSHLNPVETKESAIIEHYGYPIGNEGDH